MMRARLTSEQVAAIAVSIVCIVTVAAVLTLTWDDSPDGTRSLSVETSGHGTVSYEDSYPFGTVADVWITPDDGYVIYGITVDGEPVGLTNNLNVFMDRDRDIFIDFREASSDDVEVEVDVSITEVMGIIVTGGIGDVSKTYEWGTLTPGGTISVVPGTSVTFTLTLADGYRFVDMRINGNEVPPSETFVVGDITADMSIELWLMKTDVDPGMYVIHAEHNGHGSVTPSDCEVAAGGSVTLTVSPNDGYMVSSVLVNYSEVELSDGKLVLSDIDGNKVVSVTFEEIEYTETVTVSVGEHGSCDQQTQAVEYGSDLTFTFTPDSRYAVHSVTVDGVPVEIVDGTYVLRDIRADHVVAVTFWKAEFDIEISAGKNGSASPSGVQSVDRGGSLTVSFVPDDKYAVCSVKVDGEEVEITGNAYTFSSVSADHILVVTFRQVEFDIGISAGENGSASPSGIQRVQENESLTVVFTPSEGYTYDFVLVDGEEGTLTNGTYVFSNVLADHEISVTFKRIVITVSIDPTEGGSVEASSEAPYYYGDPLTLTFTPDVWYGLKSVTVNGVDVTAQLTDSKYVFSALTEDQTVSAVFEKYTVVDRIEVEGPSKTVYASSENTLDTSGLTVTAYYTDGSSRVVTDYELSPTDLTGKSGVVTVTVRYSESYSNTDKTVEASFSVKKASGEFTAYVTEYNGAAVNERLSQYVFDLKGLEPGGDAITFKVKVSDETGLSGVDFNACVWVQNLQDSSKNCALSKNIILTAESGGTRLFSGDLYGIADGSSLQTDVGSVPAGGMEITFTLRMSSSAGSDTMNQSLSFNLGVYAYDVEGQ
ncbi:InlB B-repeat-containing protein [Methanomethylophilus alvi]|uniref:InlB B-repeat-containing protein n=1 Tax=Methanomethylophilus alvi TaxID=1291540 RepID=UPI0037DDA24A